MSHYLTLPDVTVTHTEATLPHFLTSHYLTLDVTHSHTAWCHTSSHCPHVCDTDRLPPASNKRLSPPHALAPIRINTQGGIDVGSSAGWWEPPHVQGIAPPILHPRGSLFSPRLPGSEMRLSILKRWRKCARKCLLQILLSVYIVCICLSAWGV